MIEPKKFIRDLVLDDLIKKLEDDLKKATEGAELEKRSGMFFNHGFREGEVYTLQKVIALLKEVKDE
jgi:hypothetical protein